MKPDARELLTAIASGERPREAGERIGIHPNRVAALCQKWTRRGYYDYGVSLDMGFITEKGRELVRSWSKSLEKN